MNQDLHFHMEETNKYKATRRTFAHKVCDFSNRRKDLFVASLLP